MKIVLQDGAEFESERLDHERWLSYLYYTENRSVNVERLESVEEVSGRETLCYVFHTLALLEEERQAGMLTEAEYELVKTVLEWSEVSKGGTERERDGWRAKGYALDIHNIASAEIFREECVAAVGVAAASVSDGATDDANRGAECDNSHIIEVLISTHGLVGQAIRGEVPVADNRPLTELIPALGEESLYRILSVLNHCVIGGVSRELWDRVSGEADRMIRRILAGDFAEFPTRERMARLDRRLEEADEELAVMFRDEIFPRYELWYFPSAFAGFTPDQMKWLLREMLLKVEDGVKYLSFKPLADGLYYDYMGKKHINVYKERIIEKYMRDSSVENVELIVKRVGRAMLVDFRFSAVCEKLIDFCVEAERCGLLTFEKSITTLYDMFGFRRDEFDRLNNEEKYLATMNASESSTKNTVIDYVVGETVVDVGSGGGVLLDLLEERYPEKTIIGTDISDNVIRVLEDKRKQEGHAWTVVRHNFATDRFATQVDTVVFSSILHEIFSYTETERGRFEISSVEQALRNAYDSLRPGGRIVIRDGVKSPVDDSTITVTFKDPAGIAFFRNYERDFQGLKDIPDRKIVVDEAAGKVTACTNYAREFLYTYTWGQESYAHEVQEQFGYYTIGEFRAFFEQLGAKIIRCEAFLEPGYVTHLSPKVELSVDTYPDSNCIVVAEKPGGSSER